MASIWYMGSANVREISQRDWARAGVIGSTVQWSEDNGFSVNAASFSEAQLAKLVGPEFVQSDTDGPRPGATGTPSEVSNINDVIAEAVGALTAGAPGALDTLTELAAAIGNDADFANHLATSLAGKASTSYVDSAVATGVAGKATTAYVDSAVSTGVAGKASTGYVDSAVATATSTLNDSITATRGASIAFSVALGG